METLIKLVYLFSPLLYPGYCITSLFLHTEKADHLSKIHFEIAWWFHSKYTCETTLSTFINFTHRIKYKCTQLCIKNAAQTEAFTWVEQTLLSRHACCLDIKSVILLLRWSWFSFPPPHISHTVITSLSLVATSICLLAKDSLTMFIK